MTEILFERRLWIPDDCNVPFMFYPLAVQLYLGLNHPSPTTHYHYQKVFNPHKPGVFSKQFILKSAVSAIFSHTKQQNPFQGTLGTQDHTSIGSKTNHGPSMDPTWTLKWTSKFPSLFQAKFTISTLYIL